MMIKNNKTQIPASQLWMPSIITRLTQAEDVSGIMPALYSFETYVTEIQQDLIKLLNTKKIPLDITQPAQACILTYGMPDLTLFNPDSAKDIETVRKLLEETIEQFEQRLTNVTVLSKKQIQKTAPTMMSFCINAQIKINPQYMPIRFDSVIEPANDTVQILNPMKRA
ncbi:MAG: type VI secretion system baseplate subunit TssE [Pseudomonadota bacterium]